MSASPPSLSRHEWGVLQHLHVEADTATALRAICQMAFTEHCRGAEAYEVRDGELRLLWADSQGVKLPFRLDTPDAVYEFVSRWLKQQDYGAEPDTDGSTKRGFCARHDYGYVFLKIKPAWIVYGK